MLFSLFSVNDFAKEGILFYSAAYSLATIGIFAVLVKMKDYTFEGYNGLAKKTTVISGNKHRISFIVGGHSFNGGLLCKILHAGGGGKNRVLPLVGYCRRIVCRCECLLLFQGDTGNVFQGRKCRN